MSDESKATGALQEFQADFEREPMNTPKPLRPERIHDGSAMDTIKRGLMHMSFRVESAGGIYMNETLDDQLIADLVSGKERPT